MRVHAGHVDGKRGEARFQGPEGLAVDAQGRYIYVTDTGNHRLRRIDFLDDTVGVTTIAGSTESGLAVSLCSFRSAP